MIYGYIRVSTDKQSVENQRYEIQRYCKSRNIDINKWIEEQISSTKDLDKRKLGKLLNKMRAGDILIVSELSRLGRNLMQIMSILHFCMQNEVRVLTIKENYELGDNINSKVLAFAFGLSAEIERNLISARTKEALARKKSEGVKLGRPVGRKSTRLKLSGKEQLIQELRQQGLNLTQIAKKLKVHRSTLNRFLHITHWWELTFKSKIREIGNNIQI